jgi:elongation factor P--(R)-beta-lysine ligase
MNVRPSPRAMFPGDFAAKLRLRHRIVQEIRFFFDNRGYTEVETPLRVPCPCIDIYIDAFPAGASLFLSASPEFHMKRLLTLDLARIYQIGHAFRAEEEGRHHSAEFTILEWYRTATDYRGIMEETEQLVMHLAETLAPRCEAFSFPFARMTVSGLYGKYAGWDPVRAWDEDRYFRDWAEKIEPALSGLGAFFLQDFPAPLAALAKIRHDDPLVCERFELFIRGLEIGNAYSELLDYDEHVRRFERAAAARRAMGKKPYPPDAGFLEALRLGLPACGGIAIGVERLIMALLGLDDINQVLAFPTERL